MSDHQQLAPLQQQLGYTFNDMSLLERALTHGSAGKVCNERLEFLGDSVLGMIIAIEIFDRHPDLPEGQLSRLRASLVNGKQLAKIAKTFELGEYLILGYGERKSGGAERASSLADAFEALVAAIYLDSDFKTVQSIVLGWYEDIWDCADISTDKDPKSSLQEWLQAKKLPLPTYELLETHGHAHDAQFEIACTVESIDHRETAIDSTRRGAEQIAAAAFLAWLNAQDNL